MAGMIRAGLRPSSVMSVKATPAVSPVEFAAQPAHLDRCGGDEHRLGPGLAATQVPLDGGAEFGGAPVQEGTVQEAVTDRLRHVHPHARRLARYRGRPRLARAAGPAYFLAHYPGAPDSRGRVAAANTTSHALLSALANHRYAAHVQKHGAGLRSQGTFPVLA